MNYYLLLLMLSLCLSACGGTSSNSGIGEQETIFPEHLPKENFSLSQDTRAGIWMLSRVIKTTAIGHDDGIKYESTLQSIEHGISVINSYNSKANILPFCTIADMFEQFELDINPTETGYSQSYSTDPNNSSLNSQGSLEITFINNRKLVGKGYRKYSYKNGSRNEIILIHAVKISDDIDMNVSNEISYSSNIETEFDAESDTAAICIAVSEVDISSYHNDIKTSENNIQYAQLFSFSSNDLQGIEIFNTTGQIGEDFSQRIGGLYYNGRDHTPWRRNFICPTDDADCLTQNTLDFNIVKNSSSGISFNTQLNASDGGYLNTQVSIIIHPVETISNTEE